MMKLFLALVLASLAVIAALFVVAVILAAVIAVGRFSRWLEARRGRRILGPIHG